METITEVLEKVENSCNEARKLMNISNTLLNNLVGSIREAINVFEGDLKRLKKHPKDKTKIKEFVDESIKEWVATKKILEDKQKPFQLGLMKRILRGIMIIYYVTKVKLQIKLYNLWKTLTGKKEEKLPDTLAFRTIFRNLNAKNDENIKILSSLKSCCTTMIDALTRASEVIEKSPNLSSEQIKGQMFSRGMHQLNEIRKKLNGLQLRFPTLARHMPGCYWYTSTSSCSSFRPNYRQA